MQIDIQHRPVNSMAVVNLDPNEQIIVEPGAMIGMSTNVNMETGMGGSNNKKKKGGLLGGLVKAAARAMFTGESFFQNTFTAQGGPGEVLMAHSLPGDLFVVDVPQQGLKVQSQSFVASDPGIELSADFGGARSFFGGEGLFLIDIQASGPGQKLLLGSFGGIQQMKVEGSLVIDTGHLVAWDSHMNFTVKKSSSGWISSFLSGEGLVCDFQGEGNVWIQTRHPLEYGTAIGQLLPPRNA
ncbi:MAG: TIGR00266 family protein [Myxococcota bacterium]